MLVAACTSWRAGWSRRQPANCKSVTIYPRAVAQGGRACVASAAAAAAAGTAAAAAAVPALVSNLSEALLLCAADWAGR